MLEHLLDPKYDDPYATSTSNLLSAQAGTVDLLTQLGSPEHVIREDEAQAARSAFAAVTNPHIPQPLTTTAILKLRVPQAVRHLAEMLTQYDWDYIEQAKEIRGYVAAKLVEETRNPDARIRLNALKLLGNLTEVGSFTERIEVTKRDASTDELARTLRARLAGLLQKPPEVQDARTKETMKEWE